MKRAKIEIQQTKPEKQKIAMMVIANISIIFVIPSKISKMREGNVYKI